MNVGLLLIVGAIGFYLARWVRARADVKNAAEGLKVRLAERRQAAVWVSVLSGAVLVFLWSKGAAS